MFLESAGDFAGLACLDMAEAFFEIANLEADEPAVFFELGFAGAAQADAAFVARQVGPHLPEPRQRVFELGQLDLEPGLGRAGPGREDVEDELAAIEHLDAGGFFQVAHLAGR